MAQATPPTPPTDPSYAPPPPEVTSCLQQSRFLHLATSNSSWPHIALMNFTYLPSSPFALPSTPNAASTPSGPVIIMTVTPSSKLHSNLTTNPRVSLLVHDWVSSHETPAPQSNTGSGSGLARYLTDLNTASLGRMSATMMGYARICDKGGEEEGYYWGVHKERNPEMAEAWKVDEGGEEGGGRPRVVVVRVGFVRVTDWRGEKTEWFAGGKGSGGIEEEAF
ncbi:hypothetical protein BJ508DRAFT_152410 [Ascobolus immersus RN42]|uniref:Uncharacterized protein n=1 Tax=Ascobolus immersus RN42 TaxID=1160509 RepID=A0A3N4I262_ASCIM|nr:hypothetical protein BJ508DRAFT_152410 [Ascobolus immersus RN42]